MKNMTSRSRKASRKPQAVRRTRNGGLSSGEAFDWARKNWNVNRRKRVVIEMPDGKQYVSRSTNAELFRGMSYYWSAPFSCEIARHNRVAEVCVGNAIRSAIVGTEMWTNFRGFTDKANHSGDVYSVVGLSRDGDVLLVKLGKLLVKARCRVDFALRPWKPKAVVADTSPSLRLVG